MDFPYGYPAGFAAALRLRGDAWSATWNYLSNRVHDDDQNKSNRFEIASDINVDLGVHAPFWGRPHNATLPNLTARKQVRYHGQGVVDGLPEWRVVEQLLRARGATPQAVWKLCYTGSVGSQTLVGIPVVDRLRNHDALRSVSRVWPFEVLVPDLPAGFAAVIHAEIWPSIVPFTHEEGSCADERQVRAVTAKWRELDQHDHLAKWFAAPDNEAARSEEGWVLGVESSASAQRFSRPGRPMSRSTTEHHTTRTTSSPAPLPALERTPCLCGCGNYARGERSRFMPGHDQRISRRAQPRRLPWADACGNDPQTP